jgi:cytochrome b561
MAVLVECYGRIEICFVFAVHHRRPQPSASPGSESVLQCLVETAAETIHLTVYLLFCKASVVGRTPTTKVHRPNALLFFVVPFFFVVIHENEW